MKNKAAPAEIGPTQKTIGKHRKKRARLQEAVNIPESAELGFCFDGGSFAGAVKLLSSFRDDGIFRFSRDKISFVRSNIHRTILGDAEWSMDQVIVKGSKTDIPEAGFTFGVDLKQFHSLATRTLTKNDLLLMYFHDDNSIMYVEQINHKTTGGSRNEAKFHKKHVPTRELTTRVIGTVGQPNVVVRSEEFFIQANLLAVAKCVKINITCSSRGIMFSGEDKEERVVKSISFDAATPDFTDTISFSIPNKQLKTIIHMRNISRPESPIRIFYQTGLPILIVCNMGPAGERNGHFKLFLKEEKKSQT